MLITKKLDNQKLIDKALSLPQTGTVELHNSYTFLKISNNFIDQLYPLLTTHLSKPEHHAHITICYPEERVVIQESDLGVAHTFEIQELCHATLEGKEYIVLLVNCPSLEALRLKYGLDPRPMYKNTHVPFHITIAKK